jgi:hypothetical protein
MSITLREAMDTPGFKLEKRGCYNWVVTTPFGIAEFSGAENGTALSQALGFLEEAVKAHRERLAR